MNVCMKELGNGKRQLIVEWSAKEVKDPRSKRMYEALIDAIDKRLVMLGMEKIPKRKRKVKK